MRRPWHKTTPLKKVACVGDSITFGAGIKTASTRSGITHRFVTVDIRRNLVMQISEDNKIEWTHAIKTPTDVHQMKNGNFLVAATRNIVEVSPKGNVLWEYKSKKDIFSAVPLANGNRLVGCSGEFRLIELNTDNKVIKEISTAGRKKHGHMHSRHIRQFSNGDYGVTLCGEGLLNRYSNEGKLLKSISLRKLATTYGVTREKTPQAYSVEELANGNLLICAGYPAFVVEVDSDEKIVWALSSKDVPSVNFIFAGGAKRLPNGNTIICNWTGHNYKGEYIPLFEVNQKKKIVWSFTDKTMLPEPLGIEVLK